MKEKFHGIISKYMLCCEQYGIFLDRRDYKEANLLSAQLSEILAEIKAVPNIHIELAKLMNHDNIYIRYWSSHHLLRKKTEKAVETLKAIVSDDTPIGIEAKYLLQEWNEGNFTDENGLL